MQGLGKRLLEKLIEECTSRGRKQMLAVIGDSTNAASVGLHHALGFRKARLVVTSFWICLAYDLRTGAGWDS